MASSYTRKHRDTGTMVTVETAEDAGLDPDGGKWVTTCDNHGYLVNSETRALALRTSPLDFCEPCQHYTGHQSFDPSAVERITREYTATGYREADESGW
jgi:hypothetical protein